MRIEELEEKIKEELSLPNHDHIEQEIEQLKAEHNVKVYCYTSPSGKKYIGITGKTLEQRAGRNGSEYVSCKRFYNAIQKYGWDNFTKEILIDNLTYQEAFQKEKELIALYDTTNPEKGYNLSLGGEAPFLGRHHTAETKEKLRQVSTEHSYWRGKHIPEEVKEKIRIKNQLNFSGEKNPMFGKHHTEETKEKIRKTFQERGISQKEKNPNYGKTGSKNPNSKTIYAIIDNEKRIFIGIREAARQLHIPSSNIVRALSQPGRFSAGKDSNGNRIYWYPIDWEENNNGHN